LTHPEVVNTYHRLTSLEFISGITMRQITSGSIIFTPTFVGYKVSGFLDAIVSTVSVFHPSFLMLLFFAPRYKAVREYAAVRWLLGGILGSFNRLLIITVYSFGKGALVGGKTVRTAIAAWVAMSPKVEMAYIVIIGMAVSLIIFH
jgi:chromate transporter